MTTNEESMNEQHEEWREIAEAPGYEVSDMGRVRSWRTPGMGGQRRARPLILKPETTYQGYQRVDLTIDGTRKRYRVHRLVLTAFTGTEPEGMEACHNNGIRTDNRFSNLRWDTRTGNQADRVKHGTDNRGSKHVSAKLTEEDVREARKRYVPGHREHGATAIARELGVSPQAMGHALNGRTWNGALEDREARQQAYTALSGAFRGLLRERTSEAVEVQEIGARGLPDTELAA